MANDAGAVLAPLPVDSLLPREGSRMQTLIDPFELASRTPPPPIAVVMPVRAAPSFPPPPVRPIALTLADVDVVVEEEPPPRRASADSSGRLRCWCSEE